MAAVIEDLQRVGRAPTRLDARRRARFAAIGALAAGTLLAVAAAWSLGNASTPGRVDPELIRLIRGMALIKGALALAAGAAVAWRFGRPFAVPLAATYVVGVWLMAAATVLIWQQALIIAAAIVFHAGGLAVLAAAWRDGGETSARWLTRRLPPQRRDA